jgi:hypothetical protein
MTDPELVKALLELLTQAQAYGYRFQKVDLDDAPTIVGMAALLESWGVTADMVRKNTSKILKNPDFPTPADILKACEADIEAAIDAKYEFNTISYRLSALEEGGQQRSVCMKEGATLEEQEAEWQKQNAPRPALEFTPEQRSETEERRARFHAGSAETDEDEN